MGKREANRSYRLKKMNDCDRQEKSNALSGVAGQKEVGSRNEKNYNSRSSTYFR